MSAGGFSKATVVQSPVYRHTLPFWERVAHRNHRQRRDTRMLAAAAEQDQMKPQDSEAAYKGRVKDKWTKRSASYDAGNSFHPPLCETLVRIADIQQGATVLDVATGTGTVALAAAPLVGPDGSVVGVDITQGMIDKAEAKLRSPEFSSLRDVMEFRCADIEAADFPDASFDHVLISSGMGYMHDTPAALARFRRWLRPGGRIAFNNPLAPIIPLMKIVTRLGARRFGAELTDFTARLGSEHSIRTALWEAGFAGIRVTKTQEALRKADTTPELYAEWVFELMENFPRAPMSHQMSQKQIAKLKQAYLPPAIEQARAMQEGDDIVAQYVMLWATAIA